MMSTRSTFSNLPISVTPYQILAALSFTSRPPSSIDIVLVKFQGDKCMQLDHKDIQRHDSYSEPALRPHYTRGSQVSQLILGICCTSLALGAANPIFVICHTTYNFFISTTGAPSSHNSLRGIFAPTQSTLLFAEKPISPFQ